MQENPEKESKNFDNETRNTLETNGLGDGFEADASENNKNQESDLRDKINLLEQKLLEANDKVLRTLAELDNQRRRAREEMDKSSKFAITNFVSDLVTVVENFFMASENSPKQEIDNNPAIKNYVMAMEMTQKELLKVLEKNNVKRIYPLNQDFDHNYHEAIANIESELKEGSVVQVVSAGYSIADRLIRPALVGVAKAKTQE